MVTAECILRGLHAEALRMGRGTSHAARVTAWMALARAKGMFEDITVLKGDANEPIVVIERVVVPAPKKGNGAGDFTTTAEIIDGDHA